ncbi:unnamed protein product [Rangifer tarandus platyrhynchus]|uniref:Uncharacterized protein n=2 Tax=Rangifer tarandus platyrhynchus TaxID=3082113 RepID=A0AC59YKC0_RANTA|nr:unnamed protein product [Rangifer tarandus platyrhynchus]
MPRSVTSHPSRSSGPRSQDHRRPSWRDSVGHCGMPLVASGPPRRGGRPETPLVPTGGREPLPEPACPGPGLHACPPPSGSPRPPGSHGCVQVGQASRWAAELVAACCHHGLCGRLGVSLRDGRLRGGP